MSPERINPGDKKNTIKTIKKRLFHLIHAPKKLNQIF